MSLSSHIAIVVRSIGERTTEACIRAVESQGFARSEIAVISASPHSVALQQSLEAGVATGKDWTLSIDADVILRHDAIARLHEVACSMPAQTSQFHGLVLDKFFQEYRPAGHHMYRTRLIPAVLERVSHNGEVARPETHALDAMTAAGFPAEKVALAVGLHDYEQHYADIFRKCFLQAHKHINRSGDILPLWRAWAQQDVDFYVALEGFCFGLHYTPEVLAHATDEVVRQAFDRLGMPEKSETLSISDPAAWATQAINRTFSSTSVGVTGFELDARDLDPARSLRNLTRSRAQKVEKLKRDYDSLQAGVYIIGAALEELGRKVKSSSGARLGSRGKREAVRASTSYSLMAPKHALNSRVQQKPGRAHQRRA